MIFILYTDMSLDWFSFFSSLFLFPSFFLKLCYRVSGRNVDAGIKDIGAFSRLTGCLISVIFLSDRRSTLFSLRFVRPTVEDGNDGYFSHSHFESLLKIQLVKKVPIAKITRSIAMSVHKRTQSSILSVYKWILLSTWY